LRPALNRASLLHEACAWFFTKGQLLILYNASLSEQMMRLSRFLALLNREARVWFGRTC